MTIGKWCLTLALAPILSGLLFTNAVMALGLGGITVNSVLNEPLDAEIVLSNVGDADQNLLRVELASSEAFFEAGVVRDYYLTQLNFSVGNNADGEAVINVSSDAAVRKSYLNFLVQLEWPAGRLIREYTLLLNLPDSSAKGSSSEAPNPNSSAASNRQTLPGESHIVVVGDTLWNVSKRLRPRGLTILQTMDALYSNNSDSFVGGDANRMKMGAVLRLPSIDEISEEQGDIVAAKIGLEAQTQTSVAVTEPILVVEGLEAEEGFSESDFVDDTVFDETNLESELAASAEYDDLIEDNGNREEITSLTSEAGDAQAVLLRKTQLENEELRERMTILESQEERRRIQSQNVAVQVNADLKTSKRESGTLVDRLIDILKEQQWYIWLAAALLVLIVIVLLRLPRAQESQTLEAENIESEVAGDDDYTLEPKVNTDAGLLLDGVDGLDLDADDNLFDETDKEIFAEVDDEVSGEIFDSMVEAVAEAEVYLSLGNLEQAVRILEKARAADSNDTACRLKLMEMSFTGGRRDELEALHLEIEQTDDDVAKAIASVIMGSEKEHTAAEEHLISEEPSALGEPAEIIKPIAELAADEDAAEGFGEIDISDLLDGGIEPGDYGKIDALSEAVLGEDFLDDGSAGGGIFAETAIDENASEMGLPNVPELDKGIEFGEVENLYDLDDIEPIEDIDAVDVKLDLANTYIEMGDPEGAREILNEIIGEADEAGQAKARAVLESM